MKKQLLMLAAIIVTMFFTGTRKGNMDKIESLRIIAEKESLTTNQQVSCQLPLSDYSHLLTTSSDNSWKTYLSPD